MSKLYIYNNEYYSWDYLHNTLGFSETEAYSTDFLSSESDTWGNVIGSGYYTYTNKNDVNTYSYFVSGVTGWLIINHLLSQQHMIPGFAKSTTVTKNGTTYNAYYFNTSSSAFYFFIEGGSSWITKDQLISNGYELPAFPSPTVLYRTYPTEKASTISPKGYVNVAPNGEAVIYKVSSAFQPAANTIYGISKWSILSQETHGGLNLGQTGKVKNITAQILSITDVTLGYCSLYADISETVLYDTTTKIGYTTFVYNYFGTKYYHILTGTGSVWSTSITGYSTTKPTSYDSFNAYFAFSGTTPLTVPISTGTYPLWNNSSVETDALGESKEVFLPWTFVFINSSGGEDDPALIPIISKFGLVNNTSGKLEVNLQFSSSRLSAKGIKYYKMLI